MQNNNPKLELNLGEENDIGFSLKIIGSRDLISKPKIRFTITEEKTGRGWIFGAKKNDGSQDNTSVHVVIPDMKTCGVLEGEKYDGKLEVIMGSKFFTPTEVDIEFIEPIKIESALMKKEKLLVESEIKEVKKQLSMSDHEKEVVNKIFLAECKKAGFHEPSLAHKEELKPLMEKAIWMVVNKRH